MIYSPIRSAIRRPIVSALDRRVGGVAGPETIPNLLVAFESSIGVFSDSGMTTPTSTSDGNVVRWAAKFASTASPLSNGAGSTPTLRASGIYAENGALLFPSSISVSRQALSVYVVGELTANTHLDGTNRMALVSGVSNSFPLLVDSVTGTLRACWTSLGAPTLYGTLPAPSSLAVFGSASGVSTVDLSINEYSETISVSNSGTDTLRALFGFFASNYCRSRVAALYIYNRKLNSAEQAVLRAYCYAKFGINKSPSRRIAAVGDSLTWGSTSTLGLTYPKQCNFSGSTELYNYGVPGSTTSTWVSSGSNRIAATVANLYSLPALQTSFMLWLGTNDLNAGVTPATVLANLQSLATSLRGYGAGTKVYVGTILPRNSASGTFESDRQTLNAAIRADSGNLALDGVMDFGANTTIGLVGQNLNTAYYGGDQVHLKNEGYAIAASVAAAVVGV
jgi:lysophospholipase L1-like esterase